MIFTVTRSPKSANSKGLYQESITTFHAERKKIVNIIFCKIEIKQGKDSRINFIH